MNNTHRMRTLQLAEAKAREALKSLGEAGLDHYQFRREMMLEGGMLINWESRFMLGIYLIVLLSSS